MPEFCKEHGEVMKCLGALENNSERNYNSIQSLHEKVDKLVKVASNGQVAITVEQLKSSALWKVIATIILSAIGIIMSRHVLP